MIVEVTRSHIKVRHEGRTIALPGEMFFPPNDKMGFALSVPNTLYWDAPHEHQALTGSERQTIIAVIRREFDRGGHTLEVN